MNGYSSISTAYVEFTVTVVAMTLTKENKLVLMNVMTCHAVVVYRRGNSYKTQVCLCRNPSSSDRQHLSYDGCLEVRGEIIRTVLCCIVY